MSSEQPQHLNQDNESIRDASYYSESYRHAKHGNKWVTGIGLGLAIGTAISFATQNIVIGLSVGIAICAAIVILKDRRR